MSELRLAGVVTGSDIKPDDSLMVNQVTNTHSNFNVARSGGTGSSFASASNSVIVSTYLDGSDYKVIRPSIVFRIPDNLIRLDENPQLLLYGSNASYTGSIVAVSNGVNVSTARSVLYGDHGVLGETLFKNTQAVESAAFSAGNEILRSSLYNTIQLNKLGKYYAGFLKGNFVITLTSKAHDFGNSPSAPSAGQTRHNTAYFSAPGSATGPVLVLRKPWFINSQGDEFPLGEDFTIKAFETQANQRNRAVEQLPFSTAIKGPASMRMRNNSYEVTKS